MNPQDYEKYKKEDKLKLRKDVIEIVGMSDENQKPQVIALIGLPGVGKSSFINTIAAALSDEWHEYAFVGSHGGAADVITGCYKSYPKVTYLKESIFKNNCMPTLIDIAGFQNEDTEKQREVLRLIFYGCLKEEEQLKGVFKYYDDQGAKGLRQKYSRNTEGLKVDRVIVLASAANDLIPRQLIKCAIKAARPSSGIPSEGKRVIPVFGVFTKCDKVDFTDPVIKRREEDFKNAVGMGESTNRYMRCENYSDAVCEKYNQTQTEVENISATRNTNTILMVDIPVLKFLKQVLDPSYNIVGDEESYHMLLGFWGLILNIVGQIQWQFLAASIIVLIVAVAFLLK